MSIDWNAVKREADVLAGKEAGLENDRLALVTRETNVKTRETAVKAAEENLDKRSADLESSMTEREADLGRREQGIKSIRNELALRNARVKTLEDDVVKADQKVSKAREEKGAANAEVTLLRKKVTELEAALAARPIVEEKVTVEQIPVETAK